MIRVGVIGLGFMGNMQSKCYQALDDVKLAAICDIDEAKLKGGGGAAGNIEGAEKPLDLTGIEQRLHNFPDHSLFVGGL